MSKESFCLSKPKLLGQLVSVNTNGVFAESYTRGPLGNRLSTSNANGVIFHAYDGDHCIADYTASGDLLASYTWGTGIDNLLAVTIYEESATNTYYAIKDHLNSVHALVDTTGEVVWSCSYSAWGTPQNSQLSIINSQFQLCYLFQGREYSTVTGLYNFRARWYDSAIGRWLSKDPIGLEGGLNLYVFCGNDPVNFVDPWGLCEKDDDYWSRFFSSLGPTYLSNLMDSLSMMTAYGQAKYSYDFFQNFDDIPANISNLLSTPEGHAQLLLNLAYGYAAGYGAGREFGGSNARVAPFGNRTGHPTGRFPHYHRRGLDSGGSTKPGQGIARHRPWDTRSTDTSFWDRF